MFQIFRKVVYPPGWLRSGWKLDTIRFRRYCKKHVPSPKQRSECHLSDLRGTYVYEYEYEYAYVRMISAFSDTASAFNLRFPPSAIRLRPSAFDFCLRRYGFGLRFPPSAIRLRTRHVTAPLLGNGCGRRTWFGRRFRTELKHVVQS